VGGRSSSRDTNRHLAEKSSTGYRVVRSQRETIRTWRSLDTLASWATGLSAVAIEVML
jgi:hypothetical protein